MLRRSSDRRRWLAGLALGALALVAAGARAQDTAIVTKARGTAATRPVPREGSWMKRHEAFLERAAKGDVDLLFLGDSITQGWGGAKGVWDRYYGPRKAANFGIGGDRTQHVLWRVKNGELDGIAPKVVVLMIGTNNARDDPADQIAEGVEAIVKDLREKLPRARVLLLGVFPRGESPDSNPFREKLAAVNERIKKLDDGGKTVKYLDIGGRFLNDDGTISREIMPDFLHLTPKGYRIWADAMEPTLWSLLDELHD